MPARLVAKVSDNRPQMSFVPVGDDVPAEGNLVLVRLNDSTFRFGMVLRGQFANFEPNAGEFVTMAHADRITHWMRIIPPVVVPAVEAETQTPKAEAPAIVERSIDRAEDVYA